MCILCFLFDIPHGIEVYTKSFCKKNNSAFFPIFENRTRKYNTTLESEDGIQRMGDLTVYGVTELYSLNFLADIENLLLLVLLFFY